METKMPEPQPELTDEQRAAVMAWIAAHPYGDQDENGVDKSTIRRNLRLTPTERLIRLESAINTLPQPKYYVNTTAR